MSWSLWNICSALQMEKENELQDLHTIEVEDDV